MDLAKLDLPVAQAAENTNLMLIHGTDNKMIDYSNLAELVINLRKGNKNNFECHVYPGAGHLIESPYSPVCTRAWHRVFRSEVQFGGNGPLHAQAQEQSWARILRFFNEHLN